MVNFINPIMQSTQKCLSRITMTQQRSYRSAQKTYQNSPSRIKMFNLNSTLSTSRLDILPGAFVNGVLFICLHTALRIKLIK